MQQETESGAEVPTAVDQSRLSKTYKTLESEQDRTTQQYDAYAINLGK